jgi:hypothetical protein
MKRLSMIARALKQKVGALAGEDKNLACEH